MHICFLCSEYPHPHYPHGGVGTFIQTLGRALVVKGIKVTVVGIGYTFDDEETSDEGVRVVRLGKSRWPKLSAFQHFYRLNSCLRNIHQTDPIDVVEGTELSFAFLEKIPGVQYLIRMNGGHHFFAKSENRGVNWWKGFQEIRSFKKADAVVGVSRYVVEYTSEYIDFENKKKGVVFNPANLERFYPADPSKTVKGRVFFAGSLCEKKGIRQLIQAMPIVKEEVPAAHLVIAGRDTIDRKLRSSYKEYLKKFISPPIKEAITFLGPVPNAEIPAHIEKAAVCCYPSHMEAMPLAWIEVMSMGKPFVASKLGPGPEIIDDGRTGLLCDPLNPRNIAEKIIYMLSNQEEAMAMGRAARKFALDNFSIERIVEQNIQLYQSLL